LPLHSSTHRVRNEDLAALRLGRDTRRQDQRRAEEVTVFLDRLAGVQANSYGQRLAFALGERALVATVLSS
jgi:hypothetical protein